jgi:hypothetical protein
VQWLDTVCPLSVPGGWRSRTRSAIREQQQGNGFDCGVACLLYAEKCGQVCACAQVNILSQHYMMQGYAAEDIGAHTDQDEITWYRAVLQAYLDSIK